MNMRDYQIEMDRRGLVTTFEAQQEIKEAMVCQNNINYFDNETDRTHWRQLKDRHIIAAVKKSMPAIEMPMDERVYKVLMDEYLENIESREVTLFWRELC